MKNIDDSFFLHSSVAIAGVSSEYNIGQGFVQCLQDSGFQGSIYPLNPSGGEVRGLKVYRSITEVPGNVDYVISCIPARLTPQLVKDSAVKRAKIVSFFTAGYSESGRQEGRNLENEVLRVARASGVRLLGPNCLGLYCPEIGLSFAADFPKEKGHVGFIGQSGGNAIYLIRVASQRGVRFSKAVSYGNARDVDECDLLEYFTTDDETTVVAAYIEGVRDGQRFHRVLRRLAAAKPVIILKGGRTRGGAVATSSHTGSLAGANESWDSLLRQTGAIRVYSLDEMADMLVTFSYMALPRGRKAVVCGSNGGFSVITADDYITAGFELPQLAAEDQRQIGSLAARFTSTDAGLMLRNPFDITNISTADGLHGMMRWLTAKRSFDMLVVQISISNSGWPSGDSPYIFWPGMFVDSVIRVHREVGKPVAVILHSVTNGGEFDRVVPLRRKCHEAGLPVYDSIPEAALAMDRFMRYHEKRVVRP